MTIRHAASQRGSTRLVVIAVLAVVAGAGFLLYGYLARSKVEPESAREIAEPFLEAVRNGQAGSAWEETTAEFKSNLGRENFLKYVDTHPLMKEPLEYYSLQTVSINGVPRTECAFGRQGAPGSGPKVRVILATEEGELKVERVIAEEIK